jgi:hypothetical protein
MRKLTGAPDDSPLPLIAVLWSIYPSRSTGLLLTRRAAPAVLCVSDVDVQVDLGHWASAPPNVGMARLMLAIISSRVTAGRMRFATKVSITALTCVGDCVSINVAN